MCTERFDFWTLLVHVCRIPDPFCRALAMVMRWKGCGVKQHSLKVTRDTVDGRNPAPVDIEIPLLNIFYRVFLYIPWWLFGIFFHQPPPPALADGDPGLALCEVWHSCCGSFFSLKHFPSLNSCGLQYDLDSIWFINAVVAKSKI